MKTLIFFLGVISIAGFTHAQILDPVKWTTESKKLNDKEFEIVYTAKIDNGWHLYSQTIKPNGPTPTSFDLEESTKYTQIGKVSEEKGIDVYDELFKMEVIYFKDQAVFKQRIRKIRNENVNIIGEIDFMSCSNGKCVPGSFDIDIDI